MSHVCHPFWKCYNTLTFCSLFDKVHNPLRLPRETSSERPKVVRTWCVLMCFAHFDFEMCFAACTFSTSQLPKVVREWCVLMCFVHLTSKCISRHNGVHFFISHLASWLSTRRFSELTFRPSGAPNHWKNTVFRDFPTFSRTCIFFLLTLSPL